MEKKNITKKIKEKVKKGRKNKLVERLVTTIEKIRPNTRYIDLETKEMFYKDNTGNYIPMQNQDYDER